MAMAMTMAKVFFSFSFFFFSLLSPMRRLMVSGDPNPNPSPNPNPNPNPNSNQNPFFAFSFPSSDITIVGLHLRGGSNGSNGGPSSGGGPSKININSALLFYRRPIKFNFSSSGTGRFSTYFSFSPSRTDSAAFTFFLTLSTLPLPLNLLRAPPPAILSLSFITTTTTTANSSSSIRVSVSVAGFVDVHLSHQDLYILLSNNAEDNKLHSWIEYDYDSHSHGALKVRLSRSNTTTAAPPQPNSPILSYPLDLSDVLSRHSILIGFASTDNCTLYQWMFAARHGAPYLMHSQPLDPNKFLAQPAQNPSPRLIKSHPWGLVLALIFAAACGAMVTFFAVFVSFSVCAHRPVAPVEYPVHPVDVVYEKIVLVGLKK